MQVTEAKTRKTMSLPKYLTIKEEANNPSIANMYIDGAIVTDKMEDTDTSAAEFRDALKALGDLKQLNLHINSPGGNVFEGISIYNMLKQSKAHVNVYIDALAASIASVIAMSGDTIFMPANSMMMIHNPYTSAVGNADELRKTADDMDQITKASVVSYLQKAGDKISEDKLRELMDNETWLTAQAAVDYGLADEVIDANQAVASLNSPFAKTFKHLPEQLVREKPKEPKQLNKENNRGLDLKSIAENARHDSQILGFSLQQIRKDIIK